MSGLNRLQPSGLHPVWSYGIAVLSPAAAAVLGLWPPFHLQSAPVSLFLCAVMISAWLGGARPGLFAAALSCLVFDYYFVVPLHSLAMKPDEIPRVAIFTVSTLFVALVTAAQRNATNSLRNARDELKETVRELQRTNDALRAESRERKDAEDRLRRSEGYLAEAQRLSHTGSWASRPEAGEVSYFSEECYRVLGFDPNGGQPGYEGVFQRVHPEDQPKLKKAVETAGRENAEFELDCRFIRPDGEVRDIHIIGHPVPSSRGDDIVEFVGTVMDITERKRAEVDRENTQNQLLHSEAFLQAAQRIAHVGSWRHDFTSGNVEISAETRRIWQIDEDEHSSVIEFFFGRVHPDERPFIEALYASACSLKTEFNAEFRIVLPDGTVRSIHSIGQPTPNRSGEIVELVGSAIDLTERKGAEEALRQARAELARVNRVTTMGELTASLAHEVNQPIAAAVTNANACVRWLAGDTPNIEKAQAAAARIVKDGTHAADIISRIRRLFKKNTAERELVKVNEVIREMIALLRGEATRYNVSVWTDLAADVPDVMGDRVQLQQVMMNLIMNSIDAMNGVDGAREITIKSQRAENGQIQVSVSDTGVGLPLQHADQIFNAFFTTKAQGTGMGLRISRSIIESHDGSLWAADNSPRGAVFNFTLPSKVETCE